MKKKILCALLCLGLCIPSAFGEENRFADVKGTDWFAPYVSICAENGLMNGTGSGNFNPSGTITVAEVAAIAARLGERLNDLSIPQGEAGQPWYQRYVDYLKDYGVTVTQAEGPANRQEFFTLLSAVTAAEPLEAINSITALPDTSDEAILSFYNAGILTGVDSYGTFAGDRTLTRSEAAAMIARILEPSLRQTFAPQPTPAQGIPSGTLNGEIAMVVNGQEFTAEELCSWIVQVAYYWDSFYYTNYNARLSWNEEVEQNILSQAIDQLVAYQGMAAWAEELGCKINELSAALTPSPSRESLSRYIQQADLLCAKHILVTDETTADSIIAALNSQPTMEQFNNILSLLGTDPGMTSNPDGYLFTAGEMVEEFESGVRALEIGAYSPEPVQSSFGFHVILRLDPLDHPSLVGQYQEAVMNDLVDQWIAASSVQMDEDIVGQIDMQGTYNAYLQSLIEAAS